MQRNCFDSPKNLNEYAPRLATSKDYLKEEILGSDTHHWASSSPWRFYTNYRSSASSPEWGEGLHPLPSVNIRGPELDFIKGVTGDANGKVRFGMFQGFICPTEKGMQWNQILSTVLAVFRKEKHNRTVLFSGILLILNYVCCGKLGKINVFGLVKSWPWALRKILKTRVHNFAGDWQVE